MCGKLVRVEEVEGGLLFGEEWAGCLGWARLGDSLPTRSSKELCLNAWQPCENSICFRQWAVVQLARWTGRGARSQARRFQMELKWNYNGHDFVTETDTLGDDAKAYLFNYGFKQSMQDSIAGREKRVSLELAIEKAEAEFGVEKPTDEQVALMATKYAVEIAEAVKVDLHATLQKRRDAIQAGSIKVGGSGQRNPFETLCWDIAADRVLVAWRAKFGKGPQRGERSTFEARVDEYLAKSRDSIEKEAKRRQTYNAKDAVEL